MTTIVGNYAVITTLSNLIGRRQEWVTNVVPAVGTELAVFFRRRSGSAEAAVREHDRVAMWVKATFSPDPSKQLAQLAPEPAPPPTRRRSTTTRMLPLLDDADGD